MTSFSKQQQIKNVPSYGSSPYTKKRLRKDINFIVGRQLRTLRLKQSLNGTQLGKILGISQQHVSRYENGVTTLSIDTIVTICLYFNLSLNEFLAPLMVLTRHSAPVSGINLNIPFSLYIDDCLVNRVQPGNLRR